MGHSRIIYQSWGKESLVIKAKAFLDSLDFDSSLTQINDALELYNVYRILKEVSYDKIILRRIYEKVARFFRLIDGARFYAFHQTVEIAYYDDYLDLIEKFEIYKSISEKVIKLLFLQEDFTLDKLLEHEELVDHFDYIIAEYMRHSDQSAEVLIRNFLEKKPDNAKPCYIPKNLAASEYEGIIWQYIDSDYPHINLVSLVSRSLSSKECPLSDDLRFHAKERAEALFSRPGVVSSQGGISIGISYEEMDEIKRVTTPQPDHFLFSFNYQWLDENKDYPTILNNFIYIFEFCDSNMRCSFPVVKSSLGKFERLLGVTGVKEYKTGHVFHIINSIARMNMHAYYSFLLKQQIYIEDVIQWFFTTYIKEEFGIDCFEVNFPSNTYTNLDKCKLAATELDGILNQFIYFVSKGPINREMYEMSSNPVIFDSIKSFIPNKYTYSNNADLDSEMNLWFSDQSALGYVAKYYQEDSKTNTFYALAKAHDLNTNDFEKYAETSLQWLEKRGSITISADGKIAINTNRISVLKDLYDHDVIITSKFSKNPEFQKFLGNGELKSISTLFSKPEQDFLNFMLNRREFSNGSDLRNKYIHSSYPKDKKQHYNDYIDILRIVIFVLIKLNEEFCYMFDHSLGNKT